MLTCAAFISGSLPRFLKWFVVIWDLPSFLSLVPGRNSGPNRKCLAIYRLSQCYVSCGYIEMAAHSLFTLLLDHLSLSLIFFMDLLLRIFVWLLLDYFFTVALYWSLGSCLALSFDAWLGVLVTEHLVWCGWVGMGMLSIGSRAWAEAEGLMHACILCAIGAGCSWNNCSWLAIATYAWVQEIATLSLSVFSYPPKLLCCINHCYVSPYFWL